MTLAAFPDAGWSEGCEAHAVSATATARRWETVESLVAATPADDHAAQWSAVGMCGCCCGPCKLPDVFCARCL